MTELNQLLQRLADAKINTRVSKHLWIDAPRLLLRTQLNLYLEAEITIIVGDVEV